MVVKAERKVGHRRELKTRSFGVPCGTVIVKVT
jgi:hypothetical protein